VALLVEPFEGGELVAFTEQGFDGFLGQVAMASADIDHEGVRAGGHGGQGFIQTVVDHLADQVFNNGSMWSGCGIGHGILRIRVSAQIKCRRKLFTTLCTQSIIILQFLSKSSKTFHAFWKN
jgi:hypothetical protein